MVFFVTSFGGPDFSGNFRVAIYRERRVRSTACTHSKGSSSLARDKTRDFHAHDLWPVEICPFNLEVVGATRLGGPLKELQQHYHEHREARRTDPL